MKKTLLTLAVAGTLTMAISACNSTKSVSGTTDTMAVDTNMSKPIDTMKKDTMKTMPPDTTKKPPVQ
ncbi:coproporphyrinogen III oxidase [Pedobacter nyackensis]|nr:coproporphyrinogen III oxidase [Pedobacter nyackensis]